MDIKVKTKNNGLFNGLQLIKTSYSYPLIGLANINFLTEDVTIKEYKNWRNQECMTFISLNDHNFVPQVIPYHCFSKFYSIEGLVKHLMKKYDVSNPGVLMYEYYNFSTLLNRLYNLDSNKFYEYENCIYHYYDQLIRVVKYEQNES